MKNKVGSAMIPDMKPKTKAGPSPGNPKGGGAITPPQAEQGPSHTTGAQGASFSFPKPQTTIGPFTLAELEAWGVRPEKIYAINDHGDRWHLITTNGRKYVKIKAA